MTETQAVASWRGLMSQHASVWCALEHELGDRHDLGVSDFEVLDRMAERIPPGEKPDCGAAKFRVQELADSVHLSQSALSRLIARLEKAGLVERSMCQDDRRGVFVLLTEAGRIRHDEALPTHRGVLASFLDR